MPRGSCGPCVRLRAVGCGSVAPGSIPEGALSCLVLSVFFPKNLPRTSICMPRFVERSFCCRPMSTPAAKLDLWTIVSRTSKAEAHLALALDLRDLALQDAEELATCRALQVAKVKRAEVAVVIPAKAARASA